MITYKCKNCGGEMSVDHVGDLYCPYCGRHHCICDAVFYMKKLKETEGGDYRG